MKILSGYRDAHKVLSDPVIAIGIFDGVHLGHRKVIGKMLNSSRGKDKTILTFDPHPETVLRPHRDIPRIMSLHHRLRLFREMGIDATVVVRFSKRISEMSPEEFIEKVIVRGIGSRQVFVGENFYFGKGASGNSKSFAMLGKKMGVEVRAVSSVKVSGATVSSTRVRYMVARGLLNEAEKLLGRPVSVLGTVVSGEGIGRTIGASTANIDPHHEVIPPPGVYAVIVEVRGKRFSGVVNVGYKPTFYGRSPKRKEPLIEVHILDFKSNIYGDDIEIFFVRKLRSERKFSDIDGLRAQIKRDIDASRKLLTCSLRKAIS